MIGKPYRGEIHDYAFIPCKDGMVVYGRPVNHPDMCNWIQTDKVVDYDPKTGILETSTYFYQLVKDE